MNLDSFMVRQKRRTVEKYLKPEAWNEIDEAAREELVEEVAPCPPPSGTEPKKPSASIS